MIPIFCDLFALPLLSRFFILNIYFYFLLSTRSSFLFFVKSFILDTMAFSNINNKIVYVLINPQTNKMSDKLKHAEPICVYYPKYLDSIFSLLAASQLDSRRENLGALATSNAVKLSNE